MKGYLSEPAHTWWPLLIPFIEDEIHYTAIQLHNFIDTWFSEWTCSCLNLSMNVRFSDWTGSCLITLPINWTYSLIQGFLSEPVHNWFWWKVIWLNLFMSEFVLYMMTLSEWTGSCLIMCRLIHDDLIYAWFSSIKPILSLNIDSFNQTYSCFNSVYFVRDHLQGPLACYNTYFMFVKTIQWLIFMMIGK